MKALLVFTLLQSAYIQPLNAFNNDLPPERTFNLILLELEHEIAEIRTSYQQEYKTLGLAIAEVRQNMLMAKTTTALVKLIYRKDHLLELLDITKQTEYADISKVRYLKGLQLIRLLYEKMLSLDHHFEAVTTFSEMSAMANPNNFEVFNEVKGILKQQQKKSNFDLPNLLGDNIYTSIVHSMVSLFNSGQSRKEKEAAIKDIECILDFTLNMHQDLNTIYFETAFLKSSSDGLLAGLEELFRAYTLPIGYQNSLEKCRSIDDWDALKEALNQYLNKMQSAILDPSKSDQAFKLQVNLEFSIDRLLQFIAQYNNFIDQGAKFYQKFAIMLSSYENEALCRGQIPGEFEVLKQKITNSIDKFNNAYKPAEINGSKLKEVLYGINEFD
ncbi:hypothetical protein [Gilvibacter sediminis]|uniref:hypothetical protein n=1 Tax=Gilvibacter sediminis TaxID=379071 RepID=UPI00235060E2|nr:hypothetical protein [Gilvibacter sediminis]MDC7996721.1 hypothetical protein [Gilvibacter sediminis]